MLSFTAAAAAQVCVADCDGNGEVTVDEIVTVVNIALGNRPLSDCFAADSSNDGAVTVDEVVAGLNFALDGCPPPAATPTPTPVTNAARIDLGGAAGARGALVSVAGMLTSGDELVVATSNDITYDTSQIRLEQDEPPSCSIDPSIGPGSVPNKMMLANVIVSGGGIETLRIGIFGLNLNAIPDGPLFSCDFRIQPGASPGNKVLANTPDASRADGTRAPVVGDDGIITVVP
jgi:hypothetical protein